MAQVINTNSHFLLVAEILFSLPLIPAIKKNN